MLNLISTAAPLVLPIIEKARQALIAPPLTVTDYTASLARSGLPKTAELLLHLLRT